jgi:hypothetical protein
MKEARMRNWRWVMIALVVMVMLPAGIQTRAQDGGGLTADQEALLARVQNAQEKYRAYDSLVEEVFGGQSKELVIRIGDNQQTISSLLNWERSSQIIREGDDQNVAATGTVTLTESGSGPRADAAGRVRTLILDYRRVDGQTYIRAAYGTDTTPDAGLPALPDGWFAVESLQTWPVLVELGMQNAVEQRGLFNDFEAMQAAAVDVTIAPGTLQDGTPVDAITVLFDAEGIRLLVGDNPGEPVLQRMLDKLDDDSNATLTVMLDGEDNPREAQTETFLHIAGVSARAFGYSQLPVSASAELTAEFARRETFSQINATFESAVIPVNP